MQIDDNKGFWNFFWSKFFTMFYEDDTKWWSSMRFSFVFMMLTSNVCFWFMWVIVCFIKQDLVSIPESVIVLYTLSNGIAYGSKLGQKSQELGIPKTKPE